MVTKKILQMIILRLTKLLSEVDFLHFHHRIFVMKYWVLENFHDICSRLLRVKLYLLIAEHLAAIGRSWLLRLAFQPFNELKVFLLGLECVEDIGLLAEEAVYRNRGLITLCLIETHLFGPITLIIIIPSIYACPLIFLPGIVFACFLSMKPGQQHQGGSIFDVIYPKTSKMNEKSHEKMFRFLGQWSKMPAAL